MDEHKLITLSYIQLPNKKWYLWYITMEPFSNRPKVHEIIVPTFEELEARIRKVQTRYKKIIVGEKEV